MVAARSSSGEHETEFTTHLLSFSTFPPPYPTISLIPNLAAMTSQLSKERSGLPASHWAAASRRHVEDCGVLRPSKPSPLFSSRPVGLAKLILIGERNGETPASELCVGTSVEDADRERTLLQRVRLQARQVRDM